MINPLEVWLSPLDDAQLECDGFTRVASTLLAKFRVEHRVYRGALLVAGVGVIRPHVYLQFANGEVCDFRARMWLGHVDDVPHGVFMPSERQRYIAEVELSLTPLSAVMFEVLTGRGLNSFERCPTF